MLRPQTGCSTFMVLDFIRVPPPAARTITAVGLGSAQHSLVARWDAHVLPG